MVIKDIKISVISDSRGKDTLESEFVGENFSVKASVPAGKSTGSHEAAVLEPKTALEKFAKIKQEILSAEFSGQKEFDEFLIAQDGTENKKNLGGNLILALSLGFARFQAKSQGLELYQYIQKLAGTKLGTPRPIFNVINGGAHAKNSLDFQEFQIIPEAGDFGIALSVGREFYRKLKEILDNKFGSGNIFLGDEAGFSAPFKNNEEAIEIMADFISQKNYPLRIGLDVAASQYYKDGVYQVSEKKYEEEELMEYYLKLMESYGIISIEDPFYEEDFGSFSKITEILSKENKLVITDDLTTTNIKRLETASDKKSGNAILIKLNQIGTLTETLEAIKMAYQNNWQAVVSHRSGETMDDFIADLAAATGAWGLKAGAPGAPERMAKYERMLAIAGHRA